MADSILTLGQLIAELSKYPEDAYIKTVKGNRIENPGRFHSYRGYYRDLALGPKVLYRGTEDEFLPFEEISYDDVSYHLSFPTQEKDDLLVLEKDRTVEEMINLSRLCVNKSFTGYKGGEFLMTKNTKIWLSTYGDNENFGLEQIIYVSELNIVFLVGKKILD